MGILKLATETAQESIGIDLSSTIDALQALFGIGIPRDSIIVEGLASPRGAHAFS